MFMHHVHELVHRYRLNDSHLQGYVNQIRRTGSQWRIYLSNAQVLHTDCVILAQGCNHQPYIPSLFENESNVCHIFKKNLIQLCMRKVHMSLEVVFQRPI